MLTLLVGSSGSGKTTFARDVFKFEDGIINFTTRQKRANEIEGIDYHFISLERFHEMKANDELIEHVEYAGNHYGISQEEFDKKSQRDFYAVVDLEGVKHLSKIAEERDISCLVIYFMIDKIHLKERMTLRGDSPEQVEKRLDHCETENNLIHQLLDSRLPVLTLDASQTQQSMQDTYHLYMKLFMKGLKRHENQWMRD